MQLNVKQFYNPVNFVYCILSLKGFSKTKSIVDYERAKKILRDCEYYRREDIDREIAKFIGV